MVSAWAMTREEFALGQEQKPELVAGEARQRVLRLDQPPEAPREREQDRVGDRHPHRVVDLFEAVEIDHHHRRADGRVGLGEAERRFEAVEEQFAVGQAGEIVVHGVVQQALLHRLEFGDVGERADEADHLAVGADHGARPQRQPHVVTVERAQAKVLRHPAAALFDDAVERGAEAVAVERMQDFEPPRRRAIERSALEPEHRLAFRTGEDLVGGHVPVPDHVAGAGERESAALDIGHERLGDAAGKGVLHHREPDQHHDEDEPAEQRRSDHVVGEKAERRECGSDHPDHE